VTSYVTPKKNSAFIFYVGLVSQANGSIFQANPTLAAGDAKVSIDGGALANLATLPTVTPAAGKMVKVSLSAAEMNGDNITVVLSDAAGAEWCDVVANIQTSARQIDDLAFPATSGRSMVVDAAGLVDANTVKVGPTGAGTAQTAGNIPSRLPAALVGGRMDSNVGSMDASSLTAAAGTTAYFTAVQAGLATLTNQTDIQGRLPAALVSGRMDASVGAMAANVMTAAAAAPDLTTELQTGLATSTALATAQTSLNTIAGYIDTEVASILTAVTAIKVKTDSLTFTVAGLADVNVVDWKGSVAVAMTGDAYARLGAPAGASVSADIATVASYVDTEVAAILAAVDTEVAAIKAKTDSMTFTVAGMVDANVVDWKGAVAPAMTGDAYARLGAPAGATHAADVAAVKVDTAAIKAKTDNLPSDPADASDIAAAFSTVNSTLGVIGGYIDTEVGAIKAKTDQLTFTVAGVLDVDVTYWKAAVAPANTGDSYARLGAPAGASIAADIAAIAGPVLTGDYKQIVFRAAPKKPVQPRKPQNGGRL
jgi:hypothetical protein